MAYELEELSLQLIGALVPLMPQIRQRDKDLESQLRRAASSIGLNVAEAAMSDPGNKRVRFHTAAGSARETQHALWQAVTWRHVRADEAERAASAAKAARKRLQGVCGCAPERASGNVVSFQVA